MAGKVIDPRQDDQKPTAKKQEIPPPSPKKQDPLPPPPKKPDPPPLPPKKQEPPPPPPKKQEPLPPLKHQEQPLEPTSEAETAAKFVFERVRQSHYDLPKTRPKVLSDVELEQKEEIEIKEEEKVVESFMGPLWKAVNEFIFGKNDVEAAAEEAQGFFEWLSSYRRKEVEKEQIATEPIVSTPSETWLSYLNRKPFNIILNYFWDENLTKIVDTRSINDVENDADDDHIDKTRSPLTTETFEELLLKIPSFVPNYTKIENINCKRMGQIFLRQVRGQKLWAVQSE